MGCMFCVSCEYAGNENPCPLCGKPCEWDEQIDHEHELSKEGLEALFDACEQVRKTSDDDSDKREVFLVKSSQKNYE